MHSLRGQGIKQARVRQGVDLYQKDEICPFDGKTRARGKGGMVKLLTIIQINDLPRGKSALMLVAGNSV
ncbi:hypothetical protein EBH50_11195 [Salmonella enterica]|uniref:Uncharacterized protein n=1 Tax=Salmonella enterica TaxID=28901 RepID=A0A403JWX9_SALER|nr:hypothetical protein [Salmonella enterica]EBW7253387.1 hypothetical protein [Salmonella enterica subsp. enterica serovar Gatow]MLE30505.1 hypothetical protein [Salmonella enterica]